MIGIKIQNSFLEKTLLAFLDGQSERFQPQHIYQVVITDFPDNTLSPNVPLITLGQKSDHFLSFPFKLAQLEKLLNSLSITYENNFFSWNSKCHQLKNKKTGKIIQVTQKESEFIDFLCICPHHQASKEDLLKHVWQYTDNVETHTIESTLYTLRQKLKKDADHFIVCKDLNYCLV